MSFASYIPFTNLDDFLDFADPRGDSQIADVSAQIDLANTDAFRLDEDLVCLKELIRDVERRKDAISHRLRVLYQHQALHGIGKAPVHRLPDEILLDIFRYCKQPARISSSDCRREQKKFFADLNESRTVHELVHTCRISHPFPQRETCRLWRDVAAKAPYLWTDVKVDIRYAFSGLAGCLESVFNRSVDQPLQLTISNGMNSDSTRYAALFQVILAESDRIESLTLDSVVQSVLGPLFSGKVRYRHLRHVHILEDVFNGAGEDDDDRRAVYGQWIVRTDMPVSLVINDLSQTPVKLEGSKLASFQLECTQRNIGSLFEVLENAPNLRLLSLTMTGGGACPKLRSPPPAITCPIRTMRVTARHSRIDLGYFFQRLHLPSLESLKISNPNRPFLTSRCTLNLINLLSRSNCPLTELSIPQLQETSYIPLMQHVLHLNILEVKGILPTAVLRAMRGGDSDLLPLLDKMSVQTHGPDLEEELLEMLETRSSAPSRPLRRVSLGFQNGIRLGEKTRQRVSRMEDMGVLFDLGT